MGFFSKLLGTDKAEERGEALYAVADGELEPIEQVPDDTFASKILGDGYAVKPTGREVYAPIAGKVASVFPTQHAVTIITDSGLEVLLHMGVDTVELKGGPFEVKVEKDQRLEQGTLVAIADWDAIKAAGKATDIIVAFTNPDKVESMTVNPAAPVKANDKVGVIVAK